MSEDPRAGHAFDRALKSGLAGLALALLGACASPPRHPEAFSFAVLGDTPYSEREERAFERMIGRINAEPLAFVVHVGDFKGAGECSDALFARRKAQFDTFAAPLVYTPGDNEWTDCRRRSMGSGDPLERLAKLRQVFFAGPRSLGAATMPTEAQDRCLAPPVAGCGCGAYPENRSWKRSGVRFVTLNVPGSENNEGFDPASDAEARCRNVANARWLERAIEASVAEHGRALVIAIQADPWRSTRGTYLALLARIEAGAARLGRPVLFIHGDTHTYVVDRPLQGPITRLETFGSPFVGWVKVDFEPDAPEVFSFEPHLEALVP